MDYTTKVLMFLLPSLIASLYGFAVVFPKTKGLYYRMPVFSMLCIAVGELAYYVLIITGSSVEECFSVASLGILGSALFLLSANIGPVARFIDDGGSDNKKTSLIALIMPAAILICFAITESTWISEYYTEEVEFRAMTMQFFTISLISALTAYFTFKAAILKHPKGSFVDCMRPYNIAVTLLLFLCGIERVFRAYTPTTPFGKSIIWLFYAAISVIILLTIPLAERGRVKYLAQ